MNTLGITFRDCFLMSVIVSLLAQMLPHVDPCERSVDMLCVLLPACCLLLLLGCIWHANFLCHSSGQINFNRFKITD